MVSPVQHISHYTTSTSPKKKKFNTGLIYILVYLDMKYEKAKYLENVFTYMWIICQDLMFCWLQTIFRVMLVCDEMSYLKSLFLDKI